MNDETTQDPTIITSRSIIATHMGVDLSTPATHPSAAHLFQSGQLVSVPHESGGYTVKGTNDAPEVGPFHGPVCVTECKLLNTVTDGHEQSSVMLHVSEASDVIITVGPERYVNAVKMAIGAVSYASN